MKPTPTLLIFHWNRLRAAWKLFQLLLYLDQQINDHISFLIKCARFIEIFTYFFP